MRTRTILSSTLACLALAACGYVTEEDSPAAVDPATETAASASYEGEPAPDFTLTGIDGETYALADYVADGKTVVLEWFNPECPVVAGIHNKGEMLAAHDRVAGDDVVWLAINSGAPGKQGHGVEINQAGVTRWNLPYPVLMDESGEVGHAYDATNTPHMFVVHGGRVVYRGAIDGSKAGAPGTNYVVDALAAIRAGEPIAEPDTRAFGCGVKYAD